MAGANLEVVTGLKEEIIRNAWVAAIKAHKYPEKPFIVEKRRGYSLIAVISFPGSWSENEWFSGADKSFGETDIDRGLFPSMKSVSVDDCAKVNSAFFKRFQRILVELKEEVKKLERENRQMVFTGHSAGGPIAILATIWVLEEHRKSNINGSRINPPKCVTFGSPLMGNFIFSHALKREKWFIHFIHFVMRYDIVPRIHLAPLSSLQPHFQNILNSLSSKSTTTVNSNSLVSTFFKTVMRNASTVVSNAACHLMGNTNTLSNTLTSFVKLSPYKPFGTFIFLTEDGKFVIVTNPDAVLQILFYSCQLISYSEKECDHIAAKSLKDHFGYEYRMQTNLEFVQLIRLDELGKLPLSSSAGRNTIITEALNELGLSSRGILSVRAAGVHEEQKMKNQEVIERKKQHINKLLNQLQDEYRSVCKVDGLGYYDTFKLQRHPKDFEANIKRLELAGIWDEITEMLKIYGLPEEFEGNNEWIQLGTRFRRLVEPLDIANYYRHLKNEDTGPYLKKGRPKRYRFTQRWLEHDRNMKELNEESSLWAEVEELGIKNKSRVFGEIEKEVVELEMKMKRWMREIEDDMLLKKSTFMEWWKTLPENHKLCSCIKDDVQRMKAI